MWRQKTLRKIVKINGNLWNVSLFEVKNNAHVANLIIVVIDTVIILKRAIIGLLLKFER